MRTHIWAITTFFTLLHLFTCVPRINYGRSLINKISSKFYLGYLDVEKPYTYEYLYIPEGWVQQGQFLMIPQSETQSVPLHFSIRISGNSQTFDQVIGLNLQNNRFKFFDPEKSYTLNQKNNKKQTEFLTTMKSIPDNKNIEDLFFDIPSVNELSKIISAKNLGLQLQAIQRIKTSLLECPDKKTYFQNYKKILTNQIREIEKQINVNERDATSANKIIQSQQTQLFSISLENDLDQLRGRLEKQILELSELYGDQNEVLREKDKVNSTAAQIFRERESVQKTLKEESQILSNYRFLFISAEQKLKQAFRIYQKALFEKDQIIQKYTKQSKKVQNVQILLNPLKAKEKQMIFKLQAIEDMLQKKKLKTRSQQINLERLREQISTQQKVQKDLKKQIDEIKGKIKTGKDMLEKSINSMKSLHEDLHSIDAVITKVNSEIVELQQNCQETSNLEQLTSNNKTYRVSGDQLNGYLQKLYQNDQNVVKSDAEYQYTVVKYQEKNWKYPENLAELNETKILKELELREIQCSPERSEFRKGIIRHIGRRIILVADIKDKQIKYLKLGSCSRLQIINNIELETGQIILWRGEKIKKEIYSLFQATCMK